MTMPTSPQPPTPQDFQVEGNEVRGKRQQQAQRLSVMEEGSGSPVRRRHAPPAFGAGVKLSERQMKKAQLAGSNQVFAANVERRAREAAAAEAVKQRKRQGVVDAASKGAVASLPGTVPTTVDGVDDPGAVSAGDRDYFSSLERPEAWQLTQPSLVLPKGVGRVPASYEEAVAMYETAAAAGDLLGHAGMGQLLAYGWGVPRDRAKAFRTLNVSVASFQCERGSAVLGQCYTYGWGTRQDYVQAMRCFRMAASGQYGDPLAQFEIARMHYYRRGTGRTTADYDNAFRWFAWSAERGFAPAQYALAMMFKHGTAPESAMAKPVVCNLVRRFAGQKAGQHRSRPRAEREKAQELRLLMSKKLAGGDRKGTEPELALKWFRAASEQGHSIATKKLWEYYGHLSDSMVPETRPGGVGTRPPAPRLLGGLDPDAVLDGGDAASPPNPDAVVPIASRRSSAGAPPSALEAAMAAVAGSGGDGIHLEDVTGDEM